MGQINVAQVQGTSDSQFTVTVPEGNTLQPRGIVRVLGQQSHQLPVAETPNYFATKFNPVDLYDGSFETDGVTLRQQVWGRSATRATMSRDTSVTDSPAGGVPLKMVPTAANDPYTQTYNSNTWSFAEGLVTQGQTWTFSVYVKANTSTNAQIFLFEVNSAGSYVQAPSVVIPIGTSWQRVSITRTITNAATDRLQVRVDGHNSSALGTELWWDGIMVERGSTPSTFTASAAPTLENPYSYKEGSIRYAVKDKKLEVYKDGIGYTQTAGSVSAGTQPVGTFGAGGGFTVAEGADDTAHSVYTSGHNFILYEGLRYNDGTTGNETLSATPNTRQFLEFVSSTSSNDFAFHTGHTNPGNVSWPQYLAIKVTQQKFGKVLNRLRWYKHTNMVGNVNIWGSNQNIQRTNFTDTGGFTYIARLHFGGQGAGGEGQQVSQSFTNIYGYRWYMIEMVDINSSALPYPQIGTQGGWAAYGLTFDKT